MQEFYITKFLRMKVKVCAGLAALTAFGGPPVPTGTPAIATAPGNPDPTGGGLSTHTAAGIPHMSLSLAGSYLEHVK